MMNATTSMAKDLCFTERHCRWFRHAMCRNCTFSIEYKNKTSRPTSKKNRSVVDVAVILLISVTSLHGHSASHDGNDERNFTQIKRDVQVRVSPSVVPINSDQPTTTPSPASSYRPSQVQSNSQKPSNAPSRQESSSPSLQPTTAFPTSEQTFSPTEAPLSNPTSIPTSPPTLSPSLSPSTIEPTILPTLDSTNSPINKITLQPSTIPSFFPKASESPTKEAQVRDPTSSPILPSPTLLAIVAPPTGAPTVSFKHKRVSSLVRDVTLSLIRNVKRLLQSNHDDELDANCTLALQSSVEQRIENEAISAVPEYESLEVEIRDILTRLNETVWSFTFDVFMEIRAARVSSVDPTQIVVGAFNSQSDKTSLIEYLKSTGCDEFYDVESLSIYVPTSSFEGQSSTKMGTSSEALYASLSVAVAAIFMTAVTICCCLHFRNKRRVNDHSISDNVMHDVLPNHKLNNNGIGVFGAPSVIGGKSKNSDVSTLGDPIPFGVIRETNDDMASTNESCSIEYDFKKAFLDLHSVSDSQMCGTVDDQVSMTENTLNDDIVATDGESDGLLPQYLRLITALADDVVTEDGDGTAHSSSDGNLPLERGYEVAVPTGILGIILESHIGNGRPLVLNVRPNTVLSSVVKVGDYIDAVDGMNVKMMNANDVSQLIVQKQDEVRILEFSRPIKRKIYHL